MRAASNAFRRSGLASVTRRTCPSRSTSARSSRAELRVTVVLKGALAASVTPLREHGSDARRRRVRAARRLLRRRRASTGSSRSGRPARGSCCASRSVDTSPTSSCRHPTTGSRSPCTAARRRRRDTVTLAAHAAEVGADAVVVIGPPYFKLDEQAQYAHFFAAATACAPLPFYVYEFAATTGYADRSGRARAAARRRRRTSSGSRSPTRRSSAFEKYLLPGFDIFVGPEALIADGMARGAVGAVSALASAFPREVAAVVRDPTPGGRGAPRRAARVRRALPAAGGAQAAPRAPGRAGARGRARTASRRSPSDERDELDAWAETRPSTYAASNSS